MIRAAPCCHVDGPRHHTPTQRGARRAGVSIRAGGAVAMVPRHLRATDPGQKHVLPSTHQPSAAGTVAPVAPAEQPAREVTTTKRKPPRGASRGERSGRGFAPPPIPRDVADDARCPQMDHVGAWGRVPNLHWCAPHDDQLRRHPRFRALPRGAPRARVGGVLSIRATGHRAVGRSAPRTTHHRVPDWRARVPGGGRSQGAGDGRALGQSRTTRGRLPQTRQPLLRFDLGARTLEQEEAANEAAVRAFNENLPSPGERVDDSDSEPDADAEPVSASAEATKNLAGTPRVRPRRREVRDMPGRKRRRRRSRARPGPRAATRVRAAPRREARVAFACLGERAGSRHGGDPRVATSRRSSLRRWACAWSIAPNFPRLGTSARFLRWARRPTGSSPWTWTSGTGGAAFVGGWRLR